MNEETNLAVPPQPSPQPSQYTMPPQPSGHRSKLLMVIAVLIVIVIGIGTLGYAFTQKIGPFAVKAYTEETFLTNLLGKMGDIHSASYSASASFAVEKRDANAVPFVSQVSNEAEERQHYQDDSTRINDVRNILSSLNNIHSPYPSTKSKPQPFPATLKALKNAGSAQRYYGSFSSTDPLTKAEYKYQRTDNGDNFTLTVTFETDAAIREIRDSSSARDQDESPSDTDTTIVGKTVTFTKNSSTYFYLSSEPPKPFLVEMGESLRMLPPDVQASGKISASTEKISDSVSNWLFNLDAEGAFGDLTYKVNADLIKHDSDYFFKINNIPSFFFGSIASIKGQWIKVPAATSSNESLYSRSELSYLSREFSDLEKTYKENREKFVTFLKKAVTVADSEKLVLFKSAPKKATVDGRSVTRYELGIRKEAILPFYTKLAEEVNKDNTLKEFRFINEDIEGMRSYLESQEFNEMFDYLDKNTEFTLSIDNAGFPAIVEYSWRIVPPDTAVQLKDKQIRINFKLALMDINKSVKIEIPKDAKNIDEISSQLEENQDFSQSKDTVVKTKLSSLRAEAEIAYNSSDSSYGNKPFKLGACSATTGTLFADLKIIKIITDAAQGDPKTATCVSTGTSGNVTAYAVSAPLISDKNYSWCIDSQGTSQQIRGAITSASCK